MESNNEEQQPNNQQSRKKNRYIILWIALGALLLINAFLLYKYLDKDEQLEETAVELRDSEDLRAELEKELAQYEIGRAHV